MTTLRPSNILAKHLATPAAIFTLLLSSNLFANSVFAAATAPVTHQHGNRNHTHPLPIQGIYHRHGNSAYGQYINRSGSITGTLTPRLPAQIPTPIPTPSATASQGGATTDTLQQGGTISGTLQQLTHTRMIPLIKPAPNTSGSVITTTSPLAKKSTAPQLTTSHPSNRYTKAQQRCERTSRNCNVCATNVQQQFSLAANGQINWRTEFWSFDWDQPYPPYQLRARDLLAGKKKYLLGIPAKHIQGFIHTNSTQYPFAASHSHRNKGGILLMEQNPQGEKYLGALFDSRGRDPSSLHAIGHYLAYGEQGKLWLKDLEHPEPTTPDIGLPLPGPAANFSGGLGLVKLAGDGHLLITTGPGGQDQRPRFNRFYHLLSRDGRPEYLTFINQAAHKTPPQWLKAYAFSENLSLISECSSGDIYAVHTSGDEDGINAIRGQGYWRLSKVVQQGQQLRLQPLIAFQNKQSLDKCSMRAAATVRVNPDNQLEFYCHGYAKNPGGSTLNVLGKAKNRFYFKVGVPH